MTAFRAFLVVAIGISWLSGCRSGTPPAPRATGSPSVESPSPTPQPTAAPSPSPTIAGAASPELAARSLYDAWQAGDRPKALQFSTQRAVDQVFNRPFFALDFAGCDAEGSGFACSYETESEELKMSITGSADTGYTVAEATFISA